MLTFSSPTQPQLAPGARILVRDAEWLVRKVDVTSNGHMAVTALGLSELVRDREAIFLTDLDRDIQILRPEDTEFVADQSARYADGLLYLESRLRQMPPTVDGLESRLHVGHRAAMDALPYQLDPALLALDQPRQRILIADTVGLGKTLEAGILLSELIARGRGKRILVVTVKSMMAQFQKELWNRFTIPLVRLDSVGLARVRAFLPTNHNPFHYYQKAIVSIDTLKQDREYRVYLESAYWDVIVIDEAHHVAERVGLARKSAAGAKRDGGSQRNKLANLLANRSDTLIMLSATPHDGRARSFASLMNMLDPTAIADPDNYTREDIQGLFIRRFKHDVADQVGVAFRPRHMAVARAPASPAEEFAFDTLVGLQARLPKRAGGAALFGTTLEKSLFSSPAACLATIRNRLKRLEDDPDAAVEVTGLQALAADLEAVTPEKFSKLTTLVALIRDTLRWTGRSATDRLVIFTERLESLHYLVEHLPSLLGLAPDAVQTLHGGMSDTEQQERVQAFGQDSHPVRLLLASDVAAEGINLHFLCHRMIHFDVPWSLMVFQQRNGRIDRYGQAFDPEIYYLMVESRNDRIKGDTRILELLTQKDDQAAANIGDPSALMGVYDVADEEAKTAQAIADGLTPADFEATFADFDPLAALLGMTEAPVVQADSRARIRPTLSLFAGDRAYALAALRALQARGRTLDVRETTDGLAFTMPEDLRDRYDQCPKEVMPHPGPLVLTDVPGAMTKAIAAGRAREEAWPEVQYLWPLHPAMAWLDDKLAAFFERPRSTRQDAPRHRAPVLRVPCGLAPDEAVVVVVGVLPSRKGHPLIQAWLGVSLRPGRSPEVQDLAALLARTQLGSAPIANDDGPLDEAEAADLKDHLAPALAAARAYFEAQRQDFENRVDGKLARQLAALDRLKGEQIGQLRLALDSVAADKRAMRQAEGERRIADLFAIHRQWVEDTLRTGNDPSLQVMALLLAR